MTDTAIGVDHGLLVMLGFCIRLVMMLMVTKMPVGRLRFLMLAIDGCSRPAKLDRQNHQEKNQTEPSHEGLLKLRWGKNARRRTHAVISRSSLLENDPADHDSGARGDAMPHWDMAPMQG
ncbi:hypothetical protein GJQ57_05365 [Ralstonia pickettii]|uniref:Uncharacterized protein n=1 Tax=Ralstonia pickettii TaxID=329 RepID=A0A7X2HK91_RALPI|nr:hypothetical protein [Ralstonia pickettii]MRS98083.1 hypothetical protein [Ralstonia pickettii]